MNAPSYFEIQADDTARAVEFYRGLFGWSFSRVESSPVEYSSIATEGSRGGLLKRPVAAPPLQSGTNAFVCSMEVNDYDRVARDILARGGIVAMPKFAVPGVCWQGYFVDPDGNTFGIFQPDPGAK
jgi:predicted enzyme related to lactoylglutathione lyase